MARFEWVRIVTVPILFFLSFLYLFWARPAAILSQEYLLADLFLGQNVFIIIAAGSNGKGSRTLNALIPIVYTSLYNYIPHFIQEGWLPAPNALRILGEDAPPVLQILHSDGAHVPHNNPTSPTDIYSAESPEAVYQIYMDQMPYNAGILPHMLERLHSLGMYDNTKVIILFDHGVLINIPESLAAIENLNPDAAKFYQEAPEEIYGAPAFPMVKDTKTSQNKIKTDSRFLAMTDVPPLILSALNPRGGIPDYTAQTPPRQSFIFPPIPNIWMHLHDMGDFLPNYLTGT